MTRCFSYCLLLWTILVATPTGSVDTTLSRNIVKQNIVPLPTNFTEDPNLLFRDSRSTYDGMRTVIVIRDIIGALYLFIALIILCDKFYVPSIYLISKSLSIPKDVVGATLMAGGVLVRPVISHFISFMNRRSHIEVGFLLGNFVYNSTLVTSVCAFVSRAQISCRTVFEGFGFSIIAIVVLKVVLWDQTVYWYECMALLFTYGAYCAFLLSSRMLCKKKQAQQPPLPLETITYPSAPIDNLELNYLTEDDCPYEPISLKWPRTWKARVIYIVTIPVVFILWILLPDSSTARGKKFYPWTFAASVVCMFWICALLEWQLLSLVEASPIPHHMSYLAVPGIFSPELITSVIVARRGFGDMALAASHGRNIFMICVSSSFPWIVSGLVLDVIDEPSDQTRSDLTVFTDGMTCDLLFLAAFSIPQVLALACFKWKLGIRLGVVMLVVYILFETTKILVMYEVIVCSL